MSGEEGTKGEERTTSSREQHAVKTRQHDGEGNGEADKDEGRGVAPGSCYEPDPRPFPFGYVSINRQN